MSSPRKAAALRPAEEVSLPALDGKTSGSGRKRGHRRAAGPSDKLLRSGARRKRKAVVKRSADAVLGGAVLDSDAIVEMQEQQLARQLEELEADSELSRSTPVALLSSLVRSPRARAAGSRPPAAGTASPRAVMPSSLSMTPAFAFSSAGGRSKRRAGSGMSPRRAVTMMPAPPASSSPRRARRGGAGKRRKLRRGRGSPKRRRRHGDGGSPATSTPTSDAGDDDAAAPPLHLPRDVDLGEYDVEEAWRKRKAPDVTQFMNSKLVICLRVTTDAEESRLAALRHRKAVRKQRMHESAVKLQSRYRGFAARRQLAGQQAAATTLQAAARGHAVRRQQRRQAEAATTLQAAARGRAARVRVAAIHETRDDAARTLGRAYRAHADRQLRMRTAAVLLLQARVRGWSTRRWAERRAKAAVTLQAAARGRAVRRQMAAEEEAERAAAATKLQAAFRGHTTRRRLADRDAFARAAAALALQRVWRGKLAREEVKGVRRNRAAGVIQKHWGARVRQKLGEQATQIQRIARGYLARMQAARLREDRLVMAVVAIQKVFRGFRARKVLGLLPHGDGDDDDDDDDGGDGDGDKETRKRRKKAGGAGGSSSSSSSFGRLGGSRRRRKRRGMWNRSIATRDDELDLLEEEEEDARLAAKALGLTEDEDSDLEGDDGYGFSDSDSDLEEETAEQARTRNSAHADVREGNYLSLVDTCTHLVPLDGAVIPEPDGIDYGESVAWTLTFWLYPTQQVIKGCGVWRTLLLKGNDFEKRRMPGIFLHYKKLQIGVCCSTERHWNKTTLTKSRLLPHMWTHVAISCTESSVTVYLNGSMDSTAYFAGPALPNREPFVLNKPPSGTKREANDYPGIGGYLEDMRWYYRDVPLAELYDLARPRPWQRIDTRDPVPVKYLDSERDLVRSASLSKDIWTVIQLKLKQKRARPWEYPASLVEKLRTERMMARRRDRRGGRMPPLLERLVYQIEEAWIADPEDLSRLLNVALMLHILLHKYFIARHLYRLLLYHRPNSAVVLWNYAILTRVAMGRPLDAMWMLQRAKKLDPKLARFRDSANFYQLALQYMPKNAQALLNSAVMCSFVMRDMQKAEWFFSRAFERGGVVANVSLNYKLFMHKWKPEAEKEALRLQRKAARRGDAGSRRLNRRPKSLRKADLGDIPEASRALAAGTGVILSSESKKDAEEDDDEEEASTSFYRVMARDSSAPVLVTAKEIAPPPYVPPQRGRRAVLVKPDAALLL